MRVADNRQESGFFFWLFKSYLKIKVRVEKITRQKISMVLILHIISLIIETMMSTCLHVFHIWNFLHAAPPCDK